MAPRGSIFLSVVLVACGVSRAPSPSPARPPSPSPAAAEAPAESPAPAAAFLSEPGPAIWTAARAARDGAFPLPSGLTGDDAADEVLAGTPVREASIGYYADLDGGGVGSLRAHLPAAVDGRSLITRLAAASGVELQEVNLTLAADSPSMRLSLTSGGELHRSDRSSGTDAVRRRAEELWASLPRAAVFEPLIEALEARVETVIAVARADGELELKWNGRSDGWPQSDTVLAFARDAGLSQPPLDSQPVPGGRLLMGCTFERETPDGYELIAHLIPRFSNRTGEDTEIMLIIRRTPD